ncbi:MAG: hypothetical protein COB37_09360 [Kordiimonadales bacterium]|nr:MAG: hypothetical protein COB37_09360 [Kordiimonadales bacterium]
MAENTPNGDSSSNAVAGEGAKASAARKRERPIEIEASWAPQDPRDKLYDDTATAQEKTQSLYRIFASFHPVLNLPILVADSFKKYGTVKALGIWVGFFVALGVLYWWLTI